MPGLNVFAADTDAEARRLFTTPQQAFTNRLRGTRGPYPPPIDDIDAYWTPAEKAQASRMLALLRRRLARHRARGLERFVELTGVDELMVVSAIYDHGARLRSYEILSQAVRRRCPPRPRRAPGARRAEARRPDRRENRP